MKTAEHVRAGCFALPRRAVRAPSSLVHTKLQRHVLLGVALQETLGTIMAQGFDPRVSNMHGALGAGAQAGSA